MSAPCLAAAVVGEAMVAFVLADAFPEKFGGDSIDEIDCHHAATAEQVRRRFALAARPHERDAASVESK